MKRRKGQLVFEFLIAAVFFFYIVLYVLNYLNTAAVVFANDFYVNSLEFKALHTSELMLHNKGVWDGGSPYVLGLAEEWPVLNSTSIQYLDAYCGSSYVSLVGMLGINQSLGHGIRIEANDTSGSILDCGQLPEGLVNVRIDRLALSETGDVIRFSVLVW